MRAPILIAAVLLASCGGGGASNNVAASGDSGSEQVTATNDVTAIDAVTGQAADMAADVNFTFNEAEMNALGNDAAENSANNSTED